MDESDDIDDRKVLYDEFMDAHGLLVELEHELSILIRKDFNHIGVGFAQDKHHVKVVELLMTHPLQIDYI